MAQKASSQSDDIYLRSLEQLQGIRRFEGEPAQFWPAYLGSLLRISESRRGVIVVGTDGATQGWRIVAAQPDSAGSGSGLAPFTEALAEVGAKCIEDGAARSVQSDGTILAVALQTGTTSDKCLAVIDLERPSTAQARETTRRLRLVTDVPAGYQLQRVASEARTRVEHFASVLDLMVLVNEEKRFLAASMTVCNEIASRHRCERVSLGWLSKDYVRLQAMSHTDRFDKKAEAVQRLEETMEESLDQNAEIVVPTQQGGGTVSHDHQSFARAYDVANLCSLPLRIDDEPVAVCTCERQESAFTETEIRLLRLSCDQAARRLSDLKHSDRWFGARFVTWIREKIGKVLGFEHTWAKVLALLIAGGIGFLIFGQSEYRISAPLILRTEDLVYLTAPFDGHIYDVAIRVGEEVEEGATLLTLDQNDLQLQESALVAEMNRYRREFDKARASNLLADMRISLALLDQTQARLDLIRFQLSQSVITAPIEGVIVEGDQIERIGAPVRQGDILFRLAKADKLYAEIEVKEADIHELDDARTGSFALASRPQERYPIEIFRVEPEAVAKEKGNVFVVHCSFLGDSFDWWRPGMTGIAKLSAGSRPIWWILSHRTVEFLRLRLWW